MLAAWLPKFSTCDYVRTKVLHSPLPEITANAFGVRTRCFREIARVWNGNFSLVQRWHSINLLVQIVFSYTTVDVAHIFFLLSLSRSPYLIFRVRKYTHKNCVVCTDFSINWMLCKLFALILLNLPWLRVLKASKECYYMKLANLSFRSSFRIFDPKCLSVCVWLCIVPSIYFNLFRIFPSTTT